MLFRRPGLASFLFGLVIATHPAYAATTLPTGFVETQLATNLVSPIAMAFAPDGRLFIIQQYGSILIFKNGAILPTPFLTLTVATDGDQGIIAIGFDPNFATNQLVYVEYTVPGNPPHNRISSFVANGDVAVANSEVPLFELAPIVQNAHYGGGLRFGTDGKLYTAVGDNFTDTNGQSMTTLHGKVIRINANGTIPTDNPFYNTTTGNLRAIYALGVRNPFTWAFQPGTNTMFINDVGFNSWEEVNKAPTAGLNFGWASVEGTSANPGAFTNPIYTYPHGSPSDNTGCAVTGAAFYSPGASQFPSTYNGKYFFMDFCSGWMRYLDPANNQSTVFARGIVTPIDLTAWDGDLYYLIRGDIGGQGAQATGKLYKISYTLSQPPQITAQPQNVGTFVGDPATFSVTASGSNLSYQWQIAGGTDIAGATGATYIIPSAQLSQDGSSYRCKVSNSLGTVFSNYAFLIVSGDQAPVPVIANPADGTKYRIGDTIAFSGSASDPEDGNNMPASALTWRVDFHHDQHVHPFVAPISGITSGSFVVAANNHTEPNVWFRIYLTATDSMGRSRTVFREVFPFRNTITLNSQPSGLKVSLDGVLATAPSASQSVVGTVRSVSAPSPQMLNGGTYIFSSWSDAGAITHPVTTTDANQNFTATFSTYQGTLPISDEFHSQSLNSGLWTFVNPAGDGSYSVNGTNLLLNVPGGVSHDPWSAGNKAVRASQGIPNSDFEAEAKFESLPALYSQMQGIMVEQDASTFIRFDVYHDGTTRRLFLANIAGTVGTVRVNAPINITAAPIYLRLKRLGTQWTASWSTNGTSFTIANTFTLAMTVAGVGPFAANHGNPVSASPAWTASVDYFFNTSSPIIPEDGSGGSDMTPPSISKIGVTPGQTGATIQWTTDEPATSQVQYGASNTLTPLDSSLVTSHTVTLANLVCATQYSYKVSSTDGANNTASSSPANFTTAACATGSGPVSDDFSAPNLNPIWNFVNPVGDGSFNLNGTNLLLSVPAGVSHDPWVNSDKAARMMQLIPNSDFEVEVKFESLPTSFSQMEGIIVEQDATNYLRFDLYHDGTTRRLFAATLSGATGIVRLSNPIAIAASPVYLRLKRQGSQWICSWSTNGTTFTQAVSFTFAMTAAKVGPFAANHGNPVSASPAWTASVDYFFNTSSPIIPEDGSGGSDMTPPSISKIGVTPGQTGATIQWTTDEPATSQVQYGASNTLTPLDSSLVTSHTVTLANLVCATQYSYKVSSTDGANNTASSSPANFTTAACATGSGPVSDDFSAPNLNPIWNFVNPVGDGSFNLNGTNLLLSVPAGVSHDPWVNSDKAARMMQLIPNSDFEVEVKFESLPTSFSQMEGIIVEQDATNYLRFDLYHDGTTRRLFAATLSGATGVVRLSNPIAIAASPVYLRLKRQGSQWTCSWSTNGATFTQAVSFTFAMTAAKVGHFAANHGNPVSASPAWTASVDYFFNVANPIQPEN